MFIYIILYLIIFNLHITSSGIIYDKYLRQPRSSYKIGYTERVTYHVSLSFLVFMVFLMAMLCLLFLGILKGLLGLLCCAPVGMWGLGSLIDLPRPLEKYQESSLQEIPVKYDATGWPIHPETGKRSVRALTKKTEFFLNAIFFLTYPLAMVVTLISASCFKETTADDQCYQCVNTIVFDGCASQRKKEAEEAVKNQEKKRTKSKCTYNDGDSTEDNDTNYVVYQMHRSKQSLHVKAIY